MTSPPSGPWEEALDILDAFARLTNARRGGHRRGCSPPWATPAERRLSGGLLGNYAELTVADGRIEMTAFGRTAELNRGGDPESWKLVGPPDSLARYGDFNIPRYWPPPAHRAGGDPPARRAPHRREHPDLLLKDQYVRFTAIAERVDFLETAAAAVFDRLTTGKLPGPGRIAKVLGPMVRQGRLKIHSVHPTEQAFLDEIGLSGAYPPVRGQFLRVATGTASQSKVDAFLRREIRYDAVVDPGTGRTDALVTVTLHNDAPASGLPAYVIGGHYVPPGVNRSYVAVDSPLRLVSADVEGHPFTMEEETELGRWVATGYVNVPPESSVTIRVRLAGTVAMRIDEDGATRLRLDAARQAVVAPDGLDIRIRLTPGWADSATGRNEITHVGAQSEALALETQLIDEATK